MRLVFACAVLAGATSLAAAQDKVPTGPAAIRQPVRGKEATAGKAADSADSPLPATVHFDDEQMFAKQVDHHWELWSGRVIGDTHRPGKIKDFGLHQHEAEEAARVIHDLRLSRYGSVIGGTPPFEFWLVGEAPPQATPLIRGVVHFNPQFLKVEQVAGAWIIHDDRQMLFNFGSRIDCATSAFAVLKKYGFNQLGAIGSPPLMTYLLVDPLGPAKGSAGRLDVRDIAMKLSQEGLVLPNLGYVGSRLPLNPRRMDLLRVRGEWVIVDGNEVISQFGPNANDAREAFRLLREAQVTEKCLVGKTGFPIYLSNGQAPRQAGLGFNSYRLDPTTLKVQSVGNGSTSVICLSDASRILFEFGSEQGDADLVLKVIKHFKFDQVTTVGNTSTGGLRFLAKSR